MVIEYIPELQIIFIQVISKLDYNISICNTLGNGWYAKHHDLLTNNADLIDLQPLR